MRTVGLDISDSMIRLAVLEHHGRGFRIPVHAEIPVPDGAINDGQILQPDVVTACMKSLFDAAKPKTKFVVAALPERETFIKVLHLPADTAVNDQSVRAEAIQYVPFAPDDMFFSWHAIPPEGKTNRVVFGAAPRKTVDTYLHVLEQSGLEVVRLDIESLAISRAILLPEQTSGAYIILDMGRTRCTLALVIDSIVHFSTTLRYNGQDLDAYISQSLNISLDQAQKAKSVFGLDPDRGKGLLAKVMEPQLDALASEIERVEDFASSHLGANSLRSIILNGGGALMKGIDEALQSRLELPVMRQPAWVVSRLDPALPDAAEMGYTYTTALGLGLPS